MSRIDLLTDAARMCVSSAIKGKANPLVAFSGGKDAIVAGHIAKSVGVTQFVCEESWYFRPQTNSIKQIAERLGFDVVYKNSLGIDWLRKNKRIIFSMDSALRGWSFLVRQQATVKRHAKQIGSECQIFGRRTQENSVPSTIYQTKDGTQCHPLREWRTEDIWDYMAKHGIEKPFIYQTRYGANGPFYALHPKNHGMTVQQCWQWVQSIDERYYEGMLA